MVILAFLSVSSETWALPALTNVEPSTFFFVGRGKELRQMHDYLEKSGKAYVVGLPGIGKSQLVRQYIKIHGGEYDVIWEINDQEMPHTFLSYLFNQWGKVYPEDAERTNRILNGTENEQNAIASLVNGTKKRVLLILENFDSDVRLESFVGALSDKVHVIVTSHRSQISADIIKLDELEEDDALELLHLLSLREKSDDLGDLIRTVGNHPLALSRAGARLRLLPSVSVKDYAQNHKRHEDKVTKNDESTAMELRYKQMTKYDKSLRATYRMFLGDIQEYSSKSRELLGKMSLLGQAPMPEKLLIILADDDLIASHEAISPLVDYQILAHSNLAAGESRKYSLHSELRKVVLNDMCKEQKQRELKESLEKIAASIPSNVHQCIDEFEKNPELVEHYIALCNSCSENDVFDDHWVKIKLALAEYFLTQYASYKVAQSYLEDIERHLNMDKLEDRTQLVKVYLNKSFIETRYTFNTKLAIDYAKKALTIMDKIEVRDQGLYFRVLCQIAQYHLVQGDLASCIKVISEAEIFLGREEAKTFLGLFFYIKSWSQLEAGKYNEALETCNQAITNIKKEEGALGPLAFIMGLRASIYLKMNDDKTAKQEIEEFKGIALKLHPSKTSENFAKALLYMGTLAIKSAPDSAIEDIKQSISILDESYRGKDLYFHQGLAHQALGDAYDAKGDHEAALREYLFADDIYNKVYICHAIDSLAILYNRLSIQACKTKRDDLVRKYVKLLVDNFGYQNSHTKEVLKYLDDHNIDIPF